MFSMIVCLVVFCGIAVRRVGRFELPMWLVMTSGAVLVLVTRNISLTAAWHSISWPVIFYLFGAFVVAQALEQSQIFSSKLRAYLQKRHRALWLFIAMVIFSAVLSALLMNDAVALLFAPLLLQIAKDLDQPSEPWLLALCFAVTIGSVCSPVGNPQNLLIAMHLSGPPFVIFLHYLFIPTLVNILILIGLFYFVYKKLWQHRPDALPLNIKVDKQLGSLATVALAAFVFLIL
jgi:Na+/H+ antiporter NhaD/arsenite permease-like protein